MLFSLIPLFRSSRCSAFPRDLLYLCGHIHVWSAARVLYVRRLQVVAALLSSILRADLNPSYGFSENDLSSRQLNNQSWEQSPIGVLRSSVLGLVVCLLPQCFKSNFGMFLSTDFRSGQTADPSFTLVVQIFYYWECMICRWTILCIEVLVSSSIL